MAGTIGSIASPTQAWLDKHEASAWLGLTLSQFKQECLLYPHLLPHQVFGNTHEWYWLDLAIYAHLRQAGRTGPTSEGGTFPEDDNDEAEKKPSKSR